MRLCEIVDCGRKHSAHGLCNLHRQRELRGKYDAKPGSKAKAVVYKATYQAIPENRERINRAARKRAALPEPRARKLAENAKRRQRKLDLSLSLSEEDIQLTRQWRVDHKDDACFYCGKPGTTDDHLWPISKKGPDVYWNLVRACQYCNGSKGTKTLLEFLALEAPETPLPV